VCEVDEKSTRFAVVSIRQIVHVGFVDSSIALVSFRASEGGEGRV